MNIDSWNSGLIGSLALVGAAWDYLCPLPSASHFR
uniref:Uncharacterized protein n=1 Tax=Arundo donax TaxID=35708 RepID=A0A0A9GCT6_ARUDO